MRKAILFFIFSTLIVFSTVAQRAFEQGTSTLAIGYGIKNVNSHLFKLQSGFSNDYKTSALGPIALTYEYGISDVISVGASVGYSVLNGKYKSGSPTSDYEESLKNMNALVRANLHFGNSEFVDYYVGLGLGYSNYKYEYKDGSGGSTNPDFKMPKPVTYSMHFGLKYFFNPSFAGFGEVGYVGGSFLQFGLCAKF